MEIVSYEPKGTKKLAADLSAKLKGGDVLGLIGELGSGKTTFVQGLAEALGIEQHITSPTFIYLQVYPVSNHPSIKNLCHIDAYRVQSKEDALSVGLTDFLGREDTLSVVEWPDNIRDLLPSTTKFLEFIHIDETRRKVIGEFL